MTMHAHEALTLEILPNPRGGWTINATNDAAQITSTKFATASLDDDPHCTQLCETINRHVREHVLGWHAAQEVAPAASKDDQFLGGPSDLENFTAMLGHAGITFTQEPRFGQIHVSAPFGISVFDVAGKLLEIEGMQ